MDSLRVEFQNKYSVNQLLAFYNLKRATYYDERKRISKSDKYQEIKEEIQIIFQEGLETYGYRRIHIKLLGHNFKISPNTVLKLMNEIGIKNTVYRKHTSSYSSYRGNVGAKAPNIIKQQFNATEPYMVIHTDVTQIRLANRRWGYLSAMIDEATKEVLALKISAHPDKKMIMATVTELENTLPAGINPIVHSDQGWHYQMPDYQAKLQSLEFIQSMSRKGNCLDNAPIESFFNLLKCECLNCCKIQNIEDLTTITEDYVQWFNNERISLKTKGLSPVEYRKQVLTS